MRMEQVQFLFCLIIIARIIISLIQGGRRDDCQQCAVAISSRHRERWREQVSRVVDLLHH